MDSKSSNGEQLANRACCGFLVLFVLLLVFIFFLAVFVASLVVEPRVDPKSVREELRLGIGQK